MGDGENGDLQLRELERRSIVDREAASVELSVEVHVDGESCPNLLLQPAQKGHFEL